MLSKDTPEYEVSGGKDLDFELNPVAALQRVVGALVTPHPSTSFQPNRLTGIRDEMTTPARLSEALTSQFGRFREALDTWRKLCRRLAPGRLPKDPPSFAAEAADAREALEWHCMEAAVYLRIAQERIRLSASRLFEEPMEFYLGVPRPVEDSQLAGSAAQWEAVTRQMSGGAPPDADWPLFLARMEFLSGEMAETLKELKALALWLWTNEPAPTKVHELAGWLFDLRCECLEAVPVLTALEPCLKLWRDAAAPQP